MLFASSDSIERFAVDRVRPAAIDSARNKPLSSGARRGQRPGEFAEAVVLFLELISEN